MLKYFFKTYSVCKQGNRVEENEDAYILTYPNHGVIRVAVSDGATESSFSKEWAQLLVQYFSIFDFKNETFFEMLHPSIRRQWRNMVDQNDLPWYAQEKLELGAFATFLGLTISIKKGECNICSVGDSNVFIFRQGELLLKFPIENSADFANAPFLLSSEIKSNFREDKYFFSQEVFELQSGDILVAGTDAISQWILMQTENRINPLDKLDLINSDIDFAHWIKELRINKEIKNDDTTMIVLIFE